MRTNWEVYAREFARAVQLAWGRQVEIGPVEVSEPLSPFERKYAASGHALFEVSVPCASWSR
jgi:tRNA (guanine-N7-)-methyltransferase